MERFIQVSVLSESKAWIQEGELPVDQMPRLKDILVADNSVLRYQINLKRKKEEVSCSGNLLGTLSIACDRCGQSLGFDVDEEFTFKIVPVANLESQNGKEVLLEDEDLDYESQLYKAEIYDKLYLIAVGKERVLISKKKTYVKCNMWG